MNQFAVQLPDGNYVSLMAIAPTLPSALIHWGGVDDDDKTPLLVFNEHRNAAAIAALVGGKIVPWHPKRKEAALAR